MKISLVNLCLENIICNFGRHHLAFSTTKNATLKLGFEFLQRVYSLDVINKLYKRSLLKAEYIDFVLNRHLKVLNSIWLKDCTWDAIANKIAEIGVGLEKVHFESRESWEEIICHLSNVKSISYPIFCSNKTLAYIAKYCRNVEAVNIQHSKDVTDYGITYLCSNENGEAPCPLLKEINLMSTSVENNGMKYLLKNLPSLEKTDYLELPEIIYSLHKNDFNELDKMKPYNITSLSFHYAFCLLTFTDILQVCASVCPHLKSLECNVASQHHMYLISQFSEVEDLNLTCVQDPPFCIDDFLKSKGGQLLSLKLYNFSVSFSTLSKKCLQLSTLHLYENSFVHNNEEFTPMQRLKTLSFDTFIMRNICINKPYVQCLLSSPNLKSLCFNYNASLDSFDRELHLKCCNKINFEIRATDVIHSFIKDILMTCSSLEIFTLEEFKEIYSLNVLNELALFANTMPNRPKFIYNSFLDKFDFNLQLLQ